MESEHKLTLGICSLIAMCLCILAMSIAYVQGKFYDNHYEWRKESQAKDAYIVSK